MPNSPYPLMTPFKQIEEKPILWADDYANHKTEKEPTYDANTHQVKIPCNKCGIQKILNIKEMENLLTEIIEKDCQNNIRTMVLTDCSNAHAAIHSIQPKSSDKSTKILLDYVRDYLVYLCLKFIDAGFNLSDTGTELESQKNSW